MVKRMSYKRLNWLSGLTAIPKSDFLHLLDMMSHMRDILNRIEQVIAAPILPCSLLEMESIIAQNPTIEDKLRAWYSQITAESPTPLCSE
jgi:hypothetical protein